MANPETIKNYIADGAVGQYLIVKPGTNPNDVKVAAAGTDKVIGVSTFVAADDNSPCDVIHDGIADVICGGNVAFGDLLTSDANGKAVVAVATNRTIGTALSAGAAGDIIPVLIDLGNF